MAQRKGAWRKGTLTAALAIIGDGGHDWRSGCGRFVRTDTTGGISHCS